MTLLECMALAEILATTIFSVKLIHDCISLQSIIFPEQNEVELVAIPGYRQKNCRL